jgi:tellurite resistance protein|tara:strand:+ start:142 stop:552 length:411 start_codon:yes stop_codon:yes gene_type:complete
MGMIDHHDALIYTMVMVSAVDQDMNDEELQTIGDIIKHLPIFHDYNRNRMTKTANACAALLENEDGLDQILDLILASLPEKLRETSYALACDVAAADSHVSQEELRLLEMIRHHLDIDRLSAAAIERGARAHYILP